MSNEYTLLPWIGPGSKFPSTHEAWGISSEAPGLLCAGGDLTVETLSRAYSQAIFPWFNADQPVLWWSPDPRMVLKVQHFRLRPSFKKRLKQFIRSPSCEIRVDSAFTDVIRACANCSRPGHSGTWILPKMVNAYCRLHHAGLAHSVETWIDGKLCGGLYFVALGRAIFGESMFHHKPDTSKIALAALVAMCRQFGVTHIDCQQNTRHMASLGADEMSRSQFVSHVRAVIPMNAPTWSFTPVYWEHLIATQPALS